MSKSVYEMVTERIIEELERKYPVGTHVAWNQKRRVQLRY